MKKMKKVLILAALLAAACVADASTAASTDESSSITLDARRRTFAVSLDITLNTKIPLGTVILVK